MYLRWKIAPQRSGIGGARVVAGAVPEPTTLPVVDVCVVVNRQDRIEDAGELRMTSLEGGIVFSGLEIAIGPHDVEEAPTLSVNASAEIQDPLALTGCARPATGTPYLVLRLLNQDAGHA